MTPQERETASWKRRLDITDQKGTWTAGDGKTQRIEYCAFSRGKPKQCHVTREEALAHLTSLSKKKGRSGFVSTYRCDWCHHYHVGRR